MGDVQKAASVLQDVQTGRSVSQEVQNLQPVEKLVRHHSPEQLEAQGEKVKWRLAKPEEMLGLLRAKLIEDVEELAEAIDVNSRPQMIEVVAALRHHLGAEDVDDKIREKFFDRGDFSHGVVMTIAPAVPMVLHCPKCGEKHVDRGVFGTTHVHRTHLCSGCGHTWKPFPYATVGVESL
jgi:predicted house-cleaning noncanonical NTP pyrophosphatase (MazG superfamily)